MLFRGGKAAFNAEYRAVTGRDSIYKRATRHGASLVQQAGGDDYHPASEGEAFDPASKGEAFDFVVTRTSALYAGAQVAHPDEVVVVGGILAHFSGDQWGIRDGDWTQADVAAAMEDFLDGIQVELPGWPVYWVTAGTDAGVDPPAAQSFRQMEVAVCTAHPVCDIVADRTTEINANYVACTTDACRAQWFMADLFHWGPAAATLLMETAGKAVAQLERGDIEPPRLTVGAEPLLLRERNGQYHTVDLGTLDLSVSDNGVGGAIPPTSVVVTGATSDEAELAGGSGNTRNDIVIASECRSVDLRLEAVRPGNGRVTRSTSPSPTRAGTSGGLPTR